VLPLQQINNDCGNDGGKWFHKKETQKEKPHMQSTIEGVKEMKEEQKGVIMNKEEKIAEIEKMTFDVIDIPHTSKVKLMRSSIKQITSLFPDEFMVSDEMLERLMAVQTIVSTTCNKEEAQCAWDELDDIISILSNQRRKP
jgi:hypothetical protein